LNGFGAPVLIAVAYLSFVSVNLDTWNNWRKALAVALMSANLQSLRSKGAHVMSNRIYNALFLCTGNSARSILAESILRKDGAGRFNAFSAGSHPKGEINPYAIETLASYGYPTDGFRSKNWEEFAAPGSPQLDFVFTVCDNAAGEACPIWPGQPMTAHWGIEDPAAVEGTDIEKQRAFNLAFRYLKTRISLLLALPMDRLDKLALSKKLREIGETEGATHLAEGDIK
jgi:arsenate reductase